MVMFYKEVDGQEFQIVILTGKNKKMHIVPTTLKLVSGIKSNVSIVIPISNNFLQILTKNFSFYNKKTNI